MNIYHQIRGFYSKVFNQDHELRTTHVSLYMFLLNQNNRSNWSEWFKCPHDTAMMGALINSKTTYYKCLDELKKYGFIDYIKGKNNFKAPKIKIIDLSVQEDIVPKPESEVPNFDTLTDTQSGKLGGKASVLASVPLSGNKDIHITRNIYSEFDEKKYIGGNQVDPVEVIELTKEIASYFDVSEKNNIHNYKLIGNFVRKNFNDGKLDYLKSQFYAYKQISTNAGFKHKIKNYIGEPTERYENGAWCEKDWSKQQPSSTKVLPPRQKRINPS